LEKFEKAINIIEECKRYCKKFDVYFPENIILELHELQNETNLKFAVDDIFKILSDMLH